MLSNIGGNETRVSGRKRRVWPARSDAQLGGTEVAQGLRPNGMQKAVTGRVVVQAELECWA